MDVNSNLQYDKEMCPTKLFYISSKVKFFLIDGHLKEYLMTLLKYDTFGLSGLVGFSIYS